MPPNASRGADFDQIPVSIIFGVTVRTFFLVCGRCNTGEKEVSKYFIFQFDRIESI